MHLVVVNHDNPMGVDSLCDHLKYCKVFQDALNNQSKIIGCQSRSSLDPHKTSSSKVTSEHRYQDYTINLTTDTALLDKDTGEKNIEVILNIERSDAFILGLSSIAVCHTGSRGSNQFKDLNDWGQAIKRDGLRGLFNELSCYDGIDFSETGQENLEVDLLSEGFVSYIDSIEDNMNWIGIQPVIFSWYNGVVQFDISMVLPALEKASNGCYQFNAENLKKALNQPNLFLNDHDMMHDVLESINQYFNKES